LEDPLFDDLAFAVLDFGANNFEALSGWERGKLTFGWRSAGGCCRSAKNGLWGGPAASSRRRL